MAKIFITADTHFGDNSIIAYEKRPFLNTQEMDEQMISAWNHVVRAEDTVFHLGDVGGYPLEEMRRVIGRLAGKKILVMGNHDRDLTLKEWMACGFEEVYRHPILYDEFIVMQHQPPQYINAATPFFYLYGHVHGTEMYPTVAKQSACVSVERWDYAPVEFGYLKQCVQRLAQR